MKKPQPCDICHEIHKHGTKTRCNEIAMYCYWFKGRLYLTEKGKEKFGDVLNQFKEN